MAAKSPSNEATTSFKLEIGYPYWLVAWRTEAKHIEPKWKLRTYNMEAVMT